MGPYFYNTVSIEYITIKDGLTFGRNKGDVNFPDDGRMSGLHAKVHVKVDGHVASIMVEDLNSKNRTSVDRYELEPYQPKKLMRHSVVEMGNQKFILTDATNLNIENINTILERFEAKSVVKLEGRRLIQDIQNKVGLKIEELKSEQRILVLAMEELDKKIKLEKDKIQQVESMKAEFIKKQEQERAEYFVKLDGKIPTFLKEIEKHDIEKQKLNVEAQALDGQIQEKSVRLIKKDE